MPQHMMSRKAAPGMSKVLSSHTFLMGGEMYGTMGEDEDVVKYLQRSTKKRSTKKSKR